MNSVECPYCGAYIDYSEFDYLEMEDDDSRDYECGNCNKEFELYSHLVMEYEAYEK
ncbi:hypothetical protein [Helicobacter anseris]|uniref:hypothetical protein n=1 Tax=Helicobacter anseris TaxID=375926 RepID=UPI001473FC67|nr:hypothetical protein [Helicobacter anseris]